MINLKKAIGEQNGEAWVKLGQSIEFLLAFVPKRKNDELKRNREAFLSFAVRNWRGVTLQAIAEFTKVDNINPEDFTKDIPFSQEGLLVLMDTIDLTPDISLEAFVRAQCVNAGIFRPANWDALIKNSASGESGSSPHKKSPAQNA